MPNNKKFKYIETESFKITRNRRKGVINKPLNVKITVSVYTDEETMVEAVEDIKSIMALYDTATLMTEEAMDTINTRYNGNKCTSCTTITCSYDAENYEFFKLNVEDADLENYGIPTNLSFEEANAELDRLYEEFMACPIFWNKKLSLTEEEEIELCKKYIDLFNKIDIFSNYYHIRHNMRFLEMEILPRFILLNRRFKALMKNKGLSV